MDLRLITVRFDPAVGAFPEQPLSGVAGEVVNVVEHFFHHDGVPHVLLIVHVRAPLEQARRPAGTPSPDRLRDGGNARATLSADERGIYDRLVTWRNAAAQAEGIPPYVIATNRQIAEIARLRPTSAAALRSVHGLGDAKIRKYGKPMLALISAEGAGATGSSSPVPEGGGDES